MARMSYGWAKIRGAYRLLRLSVMGEKRRRPKIEAKGNISGAFRRGIV